MKKRVIAALMSVVMILCAFSLYACAPASEGGATTPNVAPKPTVVPDGMTALVKDGASDYVIIYTSKEASAKTIAETLAQQIETATGVSLPVVSDLEKEDKTKKEIRVGRVSRMDAVSGVYNDWARLKDTDFAVALSEGHLYLYGDIGGAAEYLLSRVLHLRHDCVYLDSTCNAVFVEDGVDTIALDGADATNVYLTLNAEDFNACDLRLTLTRENGWRIQSKRVNEESFNDMGAAQRLSAALGEEIPLTTLPVTVSETDGTIVVRGGNGRVEITKEPFQMTFYGAEDEIAASITHISAFSGVTVIEGTMDPNEAIYGTGERFNAVNQRGQSIHMFTQDLWSRADACYMVIPFLTFSRGSGILMNNYEEMYLDLGNKNLRDESDTWRAEIIDSPVDCYVYTTDRMADAIAAYTDLTGHAEMPEEWTYGMLVCRISHDLSQLWGENIKNTSEDRENGVPVGAYDVIAYMEEYDLPWTGLILEAWGGVNATGKMNDLKEICDYVHSLGKKLLLYMHVGHPGNTDLANVKGYLLEMVLPDGSTTAMLPAAKSNNPDTAFSADRVNPYVDITNPDAVEWHFEELWGYCLNEIGVDGCKIDFCEELPEYYPLQYYDSTFPTKGSHHWYPTAYSVMYWEQVSSKPDGGMCYTRGGGIGSQRAPYMWAGDQTRRYSSLKWQLNAVMSSGLSGVPFMSYDMSGYQYGNDYDGINVRDPYFEGQVFIRGLQFTAFTPCMQTHGRVRNVFEFAAGDIKCTRLYKCKCNGETVYTTKKTCTVDGVTTTHEFAFWESTTTEGFDPKTGEPIGTDYIYEIKPGELTCVVDIYRAYVKLHELLTPYITELSAEACRTGMPLVRHLALTWQDDARVHNIEDEYTFGDAFLVAPVLDDTYSRDVYLPEGCWQDLNTGDVYEIANGVCIKNGEAVGSNAEKGYTIEGYEASIVTLPVFYNMDTESGTAAGLLAGLREILAELAVIEATVPEEFR